MYEIDEHYVEEMEERRQLLDRMRAEVFASTSEVAFFTWAAPNMGGATCSQRHMALTWWPKPEYNCKGMEQHPLIL